MACAKRYGPGTPRWPARSWSRKPASLPRAAAARLRPRAAAPARLAEAVGGFSEGLYREGETDGLPQEAVLASLGCGNPLAVADLREGERVLDLGSGGGIDVLLSARRVGPSGFAYGVDMTDEMLTLARANAAKAGAANVEFRKGEIEALPLPGASVDVVISNCVINLSTDKPAVLAEMFRVLVPGGRIGITDVVAEDHLTAADRVAAGSMPAASPAPCPAPSTSTGSPRPGSPMRRSPSPTRKPRACTQRSSGPPSPPPHNGKPGPGPAAGRAAIRPVSVSTRCDRKWRLGFCPAGSCRWQLQHPGWAAGRPPGQETAARRGARRATRSARIPPGPDRIIRPCRRYPGFSRSRPGAARDARRGG